MEVRSNRPRRQVEPFGDLAMLPAFEVVQEHDFSLLFRETPERGLEPAAQLGPLGEQDGVWTALRHGIGQAVCVSDGTGSDPVPSLIPDDLEQPAREAAGVPALIDPLDRDHEPILTDIVRIRLRFGNGQRDCSARAHVAFEQSARRTAVAAPNPKHELGIRLLHFHLHDTSGPKNVAERGRRRLRHRPAVSPPPEDGAMRDHAALSTTFSQLSSSFRNIPARGVVKAHLVEGIGDPSPRLRHNSALPNVPR
jgi:hypothetical protein